MLGKGFSILTYKITLIILPFHMIRNIGLFFKEYWPKSLNEWLHTDQSLLVILSTLFFYLYGFVNIYYVCFP